MTASPPQDRQPAALTGVKVIELGTFISAPFAATLLGDFGADVIKIELPGSGDPMRTLGARAPNGESSYWWSAMGRNKQSVALDVRTPEGLDLLGRLMKGADVLVENFRPGTLDRWGITRDWMEEQSPDLIVVRISGYGQDGPWRNMPGFDRNAQAFSGLVYATGEPDMPPQQAGLPLCDYTAGLWAAFGAVVSLLGKLRHDGRGNEVELALYETMLPFLKDIPLRYRIDGQISERTGNTPDYVSPGGAYQAADGEWIFISGTGDRVFKRLMSAMGRPDMAEDPRYAVNQERVRLRPELDAVINGWLSQRTAADAIEELIEGDVPAIKVQNIKDLSEHPQVIFRENFLEVEDQEIGTLPLARPVPRIERMAGDVRWPGQKLGAATQEVLQQELGMDEEEIDALRRRGIVG